MSTEQFKDALLMKYAQQLGAAKAKLILIEIFSKDEDSKRMCREALKELEDMSK